MSKLFRHIRRSLINSNQMGKYFKYAIGEILLVVIGILIALQINNWNEKRKENALELDLLKEVKQGLTSDLEDTNFNLKSQNNDLASQRIIIKWLASNEIFHDSLSQHLSTIHYGTYFNSNEGPYQTLKQLGLRTITNDSLRNQISQLYDIDYQQYTTFNDQYIQISQKLVDKASEHFNELDFAGKRTKPRDITALRADNSYIFNLKNLTEMNNIIAKYTLPGVIAKIEKTIVMLDHEISERE